MSDTKKCSKCGEEKPATPEFFDRDKRRKGGIRSKCKECNKLYRENNKEEIKERDKLHYENNKEERKEYQKLYRENRKQNNPYGIYKITHKETGKIYIGETINFVKRVGEHKRTLKGQSHDNHLLQETFNSGGQDFDEIFEFEILEKWNMDRKQGVDFSKGRKCPKYTLLKKDLQKREAEVIEEYIRNGYNLYNIR